MTRYDAENDPLWETIDTSINGYSAAICRLLEQRQRFFVACKEAENTLRWAAQESRGKVKAEIVGGWLHHADKLRKFAKAEGA